MFPNTSQEASPPTEENQRYCWVCYASDEDDATAPWVKPCQCRGTTKWVHQSCLQRWVDEKQKGNASVKVFCPQCGIEYIISFPNMGQLMLFLHRIDAFVYKVCPFVAAGVVVGACYWVAVTYGAVTVMQVMGYERGIGMMEECDPIVLLVGLPTIPVFLILSKMVRWEDKLLRFLRFSVRRLPILNYVLPGFRSDDPPIPGSGAPTSTTEVISDPINATRVLCGALSLPTLACVVGRAFFPSCNNTFAQTLMGGVAFLAVKGLFRVYYKQQHHIMHTKRIIKDHPLHKDYEEAAAAAAAITANISNSTDNNSSAAAVISINSGTDNNTAPVVRDRLLEAAVAGLMAAQDTTIYSDVNTRAVRDDSQLAQPLINLTSSQDARTTADNIS